MLQSFEDSVSKYGVSRNDVVDFGKWLLTTVRKKNPSAIGAVCALLDNSGIKFDELDECIATESSRDDVSLSIVAMSRKLDSALLTATKVLNEISR